MVLLVRELFRAFDAFEATDLEVVLLLDDLAMDEYRPYCSFPQSRRNLMAVKFNFVDEFIISGLEIKNNGVLFYESV